MRLSLSWKNEKIVYKAIIVTSDLLEDYVRELNNDAEISEIIVGNGTYSRIIKRFFKKEIKTFEKKIQLRAKARYFELFPISGLMFLIPKVLF